MILLLSVLIIHGYCVLGTILKALRVLSLLILIIIL